MSKHLYQSSNEKFKTMPIYPADDYTLLLINSMAYQQYTHLDTHLDTHTHTHIYIYSEKKVVKIQNSTTFYRTKLYTYREKLSQYHTHTHTHNNSE